MKIKLIVCGLISAMSVIASDLKISLNSTNGQLQVSYPVVKGMNYSLVRVDMNTQYSDTFTNWTSTFTGTNTFSINPMIPSDEDQPMPSGQCYFYMVSQ